MVVLALAAVLKVQSWFGQRVVDPRTFVSPSGHVRLWVNPDLPKGNGNAVCRLSVDGNVRWKQRLPFTFAECVVDNTGATGGYTYRTGCFEIAILRPDGTVALDERHPLNRVQAVDMAPLPAGIGVFFGSSEDRMVVRVESALENPQEWWTYQLSNAKRGPTLRPAAATPEAARFIVDARPVPGTKLTLVDWWRFDGKMGAIFTLIDEAALPVWRLDLPDDYEIQGSESAKDELREAMQRQGAIVRVFPHGFELREVKRGERAKYAVEASNVREVSHTAFFASKPKAEPRLAIRSVVLTLRKKTSFPYGRLAARCMMSGSSS